MQSTGQILLKSYRLAIFIVFLNVRKQQAENIKYRSKTN